MKESSSDGVSAFLSGARASHGSGQAIVAGKKYRLDSKGRPWQTVHAIIVEPEGLRRS
jgi:hypothetical protein